MKEIVTILIGQAGVQAGISCLDLLRFEHGVQPNCDLDLKEDSIQDKNALDTFFIETPVGKRVPRFLFLDLDPSAIDEIRTGLYRRTFFAEQLYSAKEDASYNYSRGYHILGKEFIDHCQDRLRWLTNNCLDLDGFLILNSVGGGTGSGLTSLLLERLSEEFPKNSKLGFTIFPYPKTSNALVEPYNSVLATHKLLEHMDADIVLDNGALYNICIKNLDVFRPSYKDLNSVIAQVLSSVTASIRFNGALNTSIYELKSNLVPFPRARFLLSSLAPMLVCEGYYFTYPSIADMSNLIFDPEYMIARCNPRGNKYMTCSLMYRGDIARQEVSDALGFIKNSRDIEFADWCPGEFKVCINRQPPFAVPGTDFAKVKQGVGMIANSTAISDVFSRINKEFDKMFAKRAFVHLYLKEGMDDESEFLEAREDLAALEKDYEDLKTGNVEEEKEEDGNK